MNYRTRPFQFVAVGEGLAAGMGDFSLRRDGQQMSFPAHIARQLGVEFPQALLRSPGVGDVPGFARLPVRIPAPMQTRVLEQMPPSPVCDLCIPGFTSSDALRFRPVQPLVHRNDARQTAGNLILGLSALAYGEQAGTQLECALGLQPNLTLVSLGYTEVLSAAVEGNPAALPGRDLFRECHSTILSSLRAARSELLVLTIPNPLDTAYFSSMETAGRVLKIEPQLLCEIYGLEESDMISVNGLMEIGCQFFGRAVCPLPSADVLKSSTARQLTEGLGELNSILSSVARDNGALLFDLQAFLSQLHRRPLQICDRTISTDFLGGLYRLNGSYPGYTGHALIANELIDLMNREWSVNLQKVDLQTVLAVDPAAGCIPARGRAWTRQDLPPIIPQITSTFESRADTTADVETIPGVLRLPPNLEQVLPLDRTASYFGDGIGAMNCLTEQDIQWGNAGELIFDGLAMVDSHLSGSIRIRFAQPVDNKSRFEISYMGGLTGDDSILVTPQLFRMPFQRNRVDEVPGTVSSGVLDLSTGEVSDLHVYAQYSSTALLSLVGVNPGFPKQPLSFPGAYGSAWARFEQRRDGKLDFTFYGSTYVPLGKGTRWPLPFAGPEGGFATIPANGTVMHPHLQLSTKPAPASTGKCPVIPYNSVQEYTVHTHNSAFGDQFTLNTSELGGPAKGRSHVMGRIQIQYGARTGNSVPVAVTGMNPGGLLVDVEPSPITAVFPGQLSPGPQGFNEMLRFPLRTYSLDDLAIIDDPFDISMGLVDLRTGVLVNQLLHRGFIHQDLIFALLRVEPRTPKDSFFFRGPARFEEGHDGRTVFRFDGIVRVPYPAGFLFPKPNLTTGMIVGPNSVLDPFLWMQAMEDGKAPATVMCGEETNVIASTGDRFSYRYIIPANPSQVSPEFEYANHTQNGCFTLHSLAWVSFTNSRLARNPTTEFDTVTFTGFGVWRKDGLETVQQAAVQITTAPEAPYVGIQIANAEVSNVNTKPRDEAAALP
ncbi:MAG TPA: hypothetical protein VNZ47_12275 [Candidatus Dormibacteraeota bacterium]|jgi:hypothetical protein|nr:hypothetical protein [Candidatus Dormibacteraeota bacterium]